MLELHLQPQTEERIKRILGQHCNMEIFAQNIIAYQIAELKKAILNIRLDLEQFELQYQQSTEVFYESFTAGELEDTEDFIVWAGLYEMLLKNVRELEAIA